MILETERLILRPFTENDAADAFEYLHEPMVHCFACMKTETMEDAKKAVLDRAIKIGACNIYHGCVHNMLHEKSEDILRGLYKSASFVVQAIAFKQTGKYIKYQKDLLGVVSADEQKIIETFLKLKNGDTVELGKMSEELFAWSKKWITGSK